MFYEIVESCYYLFVCCSVCVSGERKLCLVFVVLFEKVDVFPHISR